MRQEELKNRYKKAVDAIAPASDQSKLAGALIRALAKFPEARKAVVDEFERIGGVLL